MMNNGVVARHFLRGNVTFPFPFFFLYPCMYVCIHSLLYAFIEIQNCELLYSRHFSLKKLTNENTKSLFFFYIIWISQPFRSFASYIYARNVWKKKIFMYIHSWIKLSRRVFSYADRGSRVFDIPDAQTCWHTSIHTASFSICGRSMRLQQATSLKTTRGVCTRAVRLID